LATTAPFEQKPREGSYAALAPLMASAEGGARAFQMLSRLAASSGGILDAGALARLTVDHARDLLGADSAALYWWQPDLEVLSLLADNDPAAGAHPPPLQPVEGAAGVAFYRCEPLLIEDYPAWGHAVPWMVERGVKAAAATPLVVERRAVGALVARSRFIKAFTAQQVETLVLLAGQAGPALEIARLFFESEQRCAEAEGLAELARQCASDPDTDRVVSLVTESACRLLGADYAGLALTTPDGDRAWRSVWGTRTDAWRSVERLRGRGPVTRALEQRRTIVVERLGESADFPLANLPLHSAEGGRTTLATPLFSREGALGALVLGWRSDVHLSQRQVRLAEALAGHAAVVFDSVRGRERLAARADEVKKLNEDLERRVVERTSELAAANRELEAFSYSVSHDLRTPLRSIDGFTQVLLEECGDRLDEAGKNHLERVRRATHRMGELIDDMLTLAKVTRRALDREDVDLSAIARSVAQELHALDPTRQIRWEIEDGIEAKADAKLMRVVFENLLGNAWKFTSKHERAVIAFGKAFGAEPVAYFVKDDGAGYDMAYADKLFGPFQRLHSLGQFEGTGVGLATVQRIIHRHGGRVWAEAAPEQGATFYFTL
jgi:signal transduction histidine kinase